MIGIHPILDPSYNRAHLALHKLWTKAVGEEDYVKEEWKELEGAIYKLKYGKSHRQRWTESDRREDEP